MVAKFNVVYTFILESKNWFVMAGKVIDGYVKQGMTLKSEDGDHNQEISSVEYVDSSLEKGLVGLAFKITSKEQLDALQRFKPNDIVKIE